ncbi:MAG: N-formylglutamate amidohydrolase [Alphaproteobacteria bacterium]
MRLLPVTDSIAPHGTLPLFPRQRAAAHQRPARRDARAGRHPRPPHAEAQALPDTDWHVDRLYDFAREMGAHLLVATHSRYVVDLNRGPDDASLYPGRFTTGLVPRTRFDATPLLPRRRSAGRGRDRRTALALLAALPRQATRGAGKLALRRAARWLVRRAFHPRRDPALFEGRLADLNLGTGGGISAAPELASSLERVAAASSFSSVLNGASRAATSPAITARRRTVSAPCSSSSRSVTT